MKGTFWADGVVGKRERLSGARRQKKEKRKNKEKRIQRKGIREMGRKDS